MPPEAVSLRLLNPYALLTDEVLASVVGHRSPASLEKAGKGICGIESMAFVLGGQENQLGKHLFKHKLKKSRGKQMEADSFCLPSIRRKGPFRAQPCARFR